MIALLLALIFLPQVDSFTQGALGERYQDAELSNRDKVVEADWQLFLDNPISGIGVGLGAEERRAFVGVPTAAHTEFTRLLAEHGMLGVLALLLLAMMSAHQFLKSRRNAAMRAVVLCFTLWSLLSTTHSAMRIAAIPLIFGLAFTQFDFGSTDEEAKHGDSD
jgi:O-antigen ligase